MVVILDAWKNKGKKGKSFVEALKIYMKSLDNLLYQGANITKKISYNAPQDLSLELLEVYYRIHTSTLKRRAQNFTLEESQQILKILNEAHEKVGNFNKNISEPPLEKIPKLSEEEDPQKLRSIIIDTCLQGLEFTKARIYLLGADTSNKNASGLFVDRKSNNLYNGIWRSPLTELDRAGGFYDEYQTLAEVTAMLKRPPPDVAPFPQLLKKAKSSAQTRPVETVKKLLELQQVYAKTRKTFREDSVRAMLIDLLNTIGIKCSGYDEIQTACFDNKSLSSSSDPIPFLSSSLPTLNTVNSGIVSTPAIGVNPSPKPPKSTVIPSTSAPTTALDLSKTILSQTSSSPLFSNTNKKFSSATAYKASSALSSSILKPSSTKSSTLPLSSLNKKILGSKVPTSSPKGIKTSSPKVMNTSSPKVMNTSSPKVMNTSSPNVMNISSTKVMDISSSKVTRTPSPKVVSSLTKGTAILSPPRQFGKGITIQRKTFLPPNSKKLSKSKSFDGTVSPKLKSIVKPNEIRNQLKNFRVNLHSVLKKSKSAKDLANNPSLSPNHNNSNITTPSNLSSKRTLPTSPLPLSTSTPYPKMISKEAPCPVPVTLNNKDKKTDIDVICID
ncbi:unnamed protein product [Lepeophtheirus salmonis]|uniref:(salmon louse) hypothetical protein n=1 Tax=Lepeophtheirus salmonis TaxID=72036 RepID=A0A7R8D5G1_LEPSM|nr:unnamed protein product [Lepeophtheirus salmonis]CAF3035117.1 unnamed protein product [Lepeophtheirus salmonis]